MERNNNDIQLYTAEKRSFEEIFRSIEVGHNELDVAERILSEALTAIRKRKEDFFDWNLTRKKLFDMAQSWVGKKVRFGGGSSGESGVMLVTCIRRPHRGCDESTLFIVDGYGKNMHSCFEFRFFHSRFLGFVDEK